MIVDRQLTNERQQKFDSILKKQISTSKHYNTGKWTEDERRKFFQAIVIYGNDWKNIQHCVSTRSCSQVKAHAQKFILRLKGYFKDLDEKMKIIENHEENEVKSSEDKTRTNEENSFEDNKLIHFFQEITSFVEHCSPKLESMMRKYTVPSIQLSSLQKIQLIKVILKCLTWSNHTSGKKSNVSIENLEYASQEYSNDEKRESRLFNKKVGSPIFFISKVSKPKAMSDLNDSELKMKTSYRKNIDLSSSSNDINRQEENVDGDIPPKIQNFFTRQSSVTQKNQSVTANAVPTTCKYLSRKKKSIKNSLNSLNDGKRGKGWEISSDNTKYNQISEEDAAHKSSMHDELSLYYFKSRKNNEKLVLNQSRAQQKSNDFERLNSEVYDCVSQNRLCENTIEDPFTLSLFDQVLIQSAGVKENTGMNDNNFPEVEYDHINGSYWPY